MRTSTGSRRHVSFLSTLERRTSTGSEAFLQLDLLVCMPTPYQFVLSSILSLECIDYIVFSLKIWAKPVTFHVRMRRSLTCVAQKRLFLRSLLPNVPANLPGPARPFNAATAPLPLQTESLTSPLICRARKFILPASPPFPEKKLKKKSLFLFSDCLSTK